MSLSRQIAEKSVQAAVAALEIYNKPDFHFREEAFSQLMTSAWELLLKAKWLSDHADDLDSLHEHNTDGSVRQGRCGNSITFGITYLNNKLLEDKNSGLSIVVHSNLLALVEIRDNAVHFISPSPKLAQRVQEIGTAAAQNYVLLAQEWFQLDLSRYNFYLMPISFYHGFESAVAASVTPQPEQISRLLDYLHSLDEHENTDQAGGPYVACRLETRIVRSKDAGAMEMRFTDDPNAPAVNVREEDVLKNYPYTYKLLTEQLQRRYSNFKARLCELI